MVPVGHPSRDIQGQLSMWIWNSGGINLGKISNIIKILVKLAKRKKRIDANKVRNEPREITNGVIDIKRIT